MRTTLIVLLLCIVFIKVSASNDTLSLPSVEVLAPTWKSYSKDKQVNRIDTLLQLNNTVSLKETLPLLGLGYVKDYGPGSSATLTYQGTAPQHNQIVWNGIPINSSLLGLSDLSLMNIQSFQQISFIPGTSSTYWGSGAIGSTIIIENLPVVENKIAFNTSYNSLDNLTYNLTASFNYQRFSTFISGSLFNFQNKFSVLDYTSPKQEIRHLDNEMKANDIQWTSVYILNKKSLLKFHLWNIGSDRDLSPSLTEVDHHARQKDNVFRAVGEWQFINKSYHFDMLAGFVKERIIFSDDATLDTGLVHSFFLEANYEKKINSYSLAFSFQSRYDQAENSSFNVGHNRSVNSLVLNISKSFYLNTEAFVNSRSEYTNTDQFIQVGSIGIQTQLKKLFLKTYLSSSYNIPTFNDLYWVPGGNEQLKPEKGINAGFDIEYKKQTGLLYNKFGTGLFYHDINDWIQWIPGSPYWRPVNYKRVISSGANIYWNFDFDIGHSNFKLLNSFQITKSINKKILEGSSFNIINKQLAYIPEYTFQNCIMYSYKSMKLNYNQQWVGVRFTTSDESEYLKPYIVANLNLEYLLQKNKLIYKPYLALNNLYSTSYESVAYRPREPRNITLGINIQFKTKNQEE